ncbi:proline dehydrogenase family protein [Halomarina pelagica]|uniref:proline dehydrogenase family protein n=1 Tax=Halomarina pelagica TaxID=2961599 RepID=UPI0020C3C316|nr:proline dehydrogenase family protein [Halomarina sp. BND7]
MIPPIARRFVAGETPAEVLEHARRLRERNVRSIINLLGEHYRDPEPAAEDAATYRQLVADVAGADVGACISVKPSQIGLGVDAETFEENLGDVVAAAEREGVFVWIDMEDHTTTDDTIDAFERFVTEHPEMGLCVQANLKRTREDLERLVASPGKIRLVKGAYDEPREIALKGRPAVNEAYREHLEYLFREYDGTVAVGSHDPAMIDRAIELHGEYGTDFEIQMLMGVREDAQVELAREYPVYQYVPYGDRWFSYFYRRVMERKENLVFALRAVAGV